MYINIWKIIIKQKRYKTLPLLFFYIFTFTALTLRLFNFIFVFTELSIEIILDISGVAKLCVGLIQAWMILEIALRLKQSVQVNFRRLNSVHTIERIIYIGKISVICLTSLGLTIFTIFAICEFCLEVNGGDLD